MGLLICYTPGADLRRIDTRSTPYLSALFNSYPWVRINTFPSTELVPTLLTGVYPHKHGIWQVKLRSNNILKARHQLVEKLPDILTTTFRCFTHLLDPSSDRLSAIPFRRIRHFEEKRFKYTKRSRPSVILNKIGGINTLFSAVTKGKGSYIFMKKFGALNGLLNRVSSEFELQFFEVYALDLYQHWNLNSNRRISKAYGIIDDFVEKLVERCEHQNITLLLLSDHGQERVNETINIRRKLRKLDLSENEYHYFIEVPSARFWFNTDRARRKIIEMLTSIDGGSVFSYEDMHKFNVRFGDDRYGEIYFIADPGYIIFPHDFYHPLANIFLGLTDWHQRGRLFNPKHRGNHGYLPEYESEKGFMLVLDSKYKIRKREADIIDVAPSVLDLLGREKMDYMTGNSVFNK
jgi:predicted AlkP superfamily pyrophosphatase or phosphodiesterase